MDMIVIIGLVLGVCALIVGCCMTVEPTVTKEYVIIDEDGKEVIVMEVR